MTTIERFETNFSGLVPEPFRATVFAAHPYLPYFSDGANSIKLTDGYTRKGSCWEVQVNNKTIGTTKYADQGLLKALKHLGLVAYGN